MQRAVLRMGLDLLMSATAPGTTVQTSYVWSEDASWKDKIFTKEQPFQDAETTKKWLERKQAYRELKAAGQL